MLAGRIVRRGRIELVERAEPRLPRAAEPGAAEIIFQPEHACLCGSDLPYFALEQPRYPLQDGLSLHEMVGTVIDTNGERFRPGDKVLAVPVNQVGLFERFPLTEERVIPVDPRKPLREIFLAQPLGTVVYALRKLPPVHGLVVAVVGQGPMGQIWCAVLRNLGAREIIAVDPCESRLALSPRMGATACIGAHGAEVAEEVSQLTGGAMADIVIECVGHQDQAMRLCVDLLRRDGILLYFGVPDGDLDGVPWREVFMKNLTIHTTVNPSFARDFPLAMRWISEDRIDLTPLITHRFPLARIQEAFETFSERRDGALKVTVDFPAAG